MSATACPNGRAHGGRQRAWRHRGRARPTDAGGAKEPRIDLLQVVVLALIQGITEFLPISSSAHLILAAKAFGWEDQGLAFDVAVHGGTLLALVAYFRHELSDMALSALRRRRDDNTALLAKVAVATVPIAIAGWLIRPLAETVLRETAVIGAATIAFGVALWWADRRPTPRRDAMSLTFAEAALIGLAQATALVPGASRAGVTITAALLLGLSREGASRFSFLLAMPAIAGAGVLTIAQAPPAAWEHVLPLALGFVIAALSAYACIAAFISLVQRTGMTPYVLYRLALGAALLLIV